MRAVTFPGQPMVARLWQRPRQGGLVGALVWAGRAALVGLGLLGLGIAETVFPPLWIAAVISAVGGAMLAAAGMAAAAVIAAALLACWAVLGLLWLGCTLTGNRDRFYRALRTPSPKRAA